MADRAWPPRRIGVVGLGLVGGSVARAARRAWPDVRITGVDREATASRAHALGICDATGAVLDLVDADLIVLAAPVDANIATLRTLAWRSCPALVTDTGSTKRTTMAAAESIRDMLAFVGGHPMAGGEHSGLEHARADLFDGRPWFVVSSRLTSAADVVYVERFATALGAQPEGVDAHVHDRAMAFVSQLPQLTASVLMRVVGELADAVTLAYAGRGLVDTTRLASSSAPWMSAAFHSNADHVVPAVDALISQLTAARDRLAAGQPIDDLWQQASECRTALLENQSHKHGA